MVVDGPSPDVRKVGARRKGACRAQEAVKKLTMSRVSRIRKNKLQMFGILHGKLQTGSATTECGFG